MENFIKHRTLLHHTQETSEVFDLIANSQLVNIFTAVYFWENNCLAAIFIITYSLPIIFSSLFKIGRALPKD